jgi:hypothetical protein
LPGAELQKLAMDSRGTPERLRRGHRLTRALISALTEGRPPVGRPESWVQYWRKRRRCHRGTVSGVAITSGRRHPAQILARTTQKSRSIWRSGAGRWFACRRRAAGAKPASRGRGGSGTTPRLGGTVPSSKRPCCHVRSTRGPVRTGRREVLSIRLDGVPFSSDRRAHRAAAVVPAAHRANASGSVSTEGAVRGAGLGGGISDSCAAATSRIMSCEWGRVSSQVVLSPAAKLGTGRWG